MLTWFSHSCRWWKGGHALYRHSWYHVQSQLYCIVECSKCHIRYVEAS